MCLLLHGPGLFCGSMQVDVSAGFVQRVSIKRLANVFSAWRVHSAHMQHLTLALEHSSKRWQACGMQWKRHQMRCIMLAWSSLSKPFSMNTVRAKRFHTKKLLRSWYQFCAVGKSTRQRQACRVQWMIESKYDRCMPVESVSGSVIITCSL